MEKLDHIQEMKKEEALQPEVPWKDIEEKTENLSNLAIENKDFFLGTLQKFASKSKSKIEGEKYVIKDLDRMREKANESYGWKVNIC